MTSSGGWCVDVGAGEVSGGWGRKATEVDSNTLKGGFVLGWGAANTEGKEGPIMPFA